ncbi:MAG: EndoU domain-containing protein [Thiolinea sp.]
MPGSISTAFTHVFCGEPSLGGPIGGLHYVGRYLQLQQSGAICRMDNLRQNEVPDRGDLFDGRDHTYPEQGMARSSIKGYGLTLSAEDILLKAATYAFVNNPRRILQTVPPACWRCGMRAAFYQCFCAAQQRYSHFLSGCHAESARSGLCQSCGFKPLTATEYQYFKQQYYRLHHSGATIIHSFGGKSLF